MSEPAPTVIVARRVRPGHERQFARWQERIGEAAARFDGYLGAEIQPPDDTHPDEWITVYRFVTTGALERWLASDERADLIREAARLLVGPAREQRLVQQTPETAVTAVMTQRVRPDAWDEFRRAHAEITLTMRDFDGFLACELVEPIDGVQDEHAVLFGFASRRDLDRWLSSPERREVLRLIEPLIEGERTLNVVGGFAGWFEPDDERTPPKWKQAVAVLIALFPTTFVLSLVQRSVDVDAPWPVALFVSNVAGIVILTWLLMPVVTRLLRPWLLR